MTVSDRCRDGRRKCKPGDNDQAALDLLRKGLLRILPDRTVQRFIYRRYKTLKLQPNETGYLFVCFRVAGARQKIALHRLVWMDANRQIIPSGHDIHHRNGRMLDNRPENLEPRLPSDHRANGTSFGAGTEIEPDEDF